MSRPRKLTAEQVRKLREWKKLTELAREFGITKSAADKVRQWHSYKDVR
jgi:hypothetical protein